MSREPRQPRNATSPAGTSGELEHARRLLREAQQAKTWFLRKASHELRAPLAAIHSILDALVQECPDLSADHARLIHAGQQRLKGLMAMLDDLREYSRLCQDNPPPQMQRVDLGAVVGDVMDLFARRAADAGLTLRYTRRSLFLDAAADLLAELVTNLLANAIQYTPASGSIDVRIDEDAGWAVLSVADTGMGLNPTDRDKLFTEFYRASEARERHAEGTGLGLAICKGIVEAHDGTISAGDNPGGGAVFTVRLPRPRA